MAEKKPSKATAKRPGKKSVDGETDGFSSEERAAMKERAKEVKAAAKRGKGSGKADGERDVLEKIAEMEDSDRRMAERLHALVKDVSPDLTPRTWYGMPAYAKNGDVIVFFQAAQKFKSRYSTLGFSDKANLDDGSMWPSSFALTELTPEVEARIRELVTRAVR